MNKIEEWIYALKVCKKYGLKFKPSFEKGYGQYDFIEGSVSVDVLNKDFMTIFLHEVGHHVHDKSVDYKNFLYKQRLTVNFRHDGRDVISCMEAESFASRFARKTKKANVQFLLKAFNTYTAVYLSPNAELCRHNLYESVVHKVYKSIRRIEK